MQVLTLKPWKLTAYLMIYGQHVRRLDVNGSHRNRTDDREEWVERTHKHRFSEVHQDTVAYTPDDIPPVPTADVVGEHYRGAFEAFCEEQAITLTASTAGLIQCCRGAREGTDDRVQHAALLRSRR